MSIYFFTGASQKPENKQEIIHPSQQTEVRTKSGKRRIQPVFVASLVSTDPEGAGTEDITDSRCFDFFLKVDIF